MSYSDLLSAEQYKCLVNLNQEDCKKLYNILVDNKIELMLGMKRGPIELCYPSELDFPLFRMVFWREESFDFVIKALKLLLIPE